MPRQPRESVGIGEFTPERVREVGADFGFMEALNPYLDDFIPPADLPIISEGFHPRAICYYSFTAGETCECFKECDDSSAGCQAFDEEPPCQVWEDDEECNLRMAQETMLDLVIRGMNGAFPFSSYWWTIRNTVTVDCPSADVDYDLHNRVQPYLTSYGEELYHEVSRVQTWDDEPGDEIAANFPANLDPIIVVSPPAGIRYAPGDTMSIGWTAQWALWSMSTNVAVTLRRASDGSLVDTITAAVPCDTNDGTLQYTIPPVSADDYQIRVASGSQVGLSPVFTIKSLNAAADASPTYGKVPLGVSFDGSGSFDTDGTIMSYEWDFDSDGVVDASGVTSSHTYTQAADHTATLTVTDNAGETDSIPVIITAVDIEVTSPAAGETYALGDQMTVSWTCDGGVGSLKLVIATADLSSGKLIVKPVSCGASPYSYTVPTDLTPGSYIVRVRETGGSPVYDDSGIFTLATPPEAVISANPTSGSSPLTVVFDGSGSFDSDGTIASYQWDFDSNGTIDATGATVTHTYTTDGVFTAKLIVTDNDGLSGFDTVPITTCDPGPSTYILYPTSVPNRNDWTQESNIIGPYDGNKAEGQPGGTTYLKATDFDDLTLPVCRTITKVECGALARFTNGESSKARIAESHSNTQNFLSLGSNWVWRDVDITALEAEWTAAEVNALQIGIQRYYANDPPASNLRVGGLRITVTVE